MKPKSAPELWKARGGEDRESVIDFVRRVYGAYLDGSFTRVDLKRLDPKCYVALSNWLRSNDLPPDLNLPTLSERYSYLIANMTEVDRELIRAYEANRHRMRRTHIKEGAS